MEIIKHPAFRTLAMIMTVLMLIASLPMYAFAADLRDLFTADATSEGAQSATDITTVAHDPIELTDRRTETAKHFRLPDGTVTMVQYGTPVHREDAAGDWQDINNHLSESGSDYATSDARVKFAKKTTGNGTIFTLHEGNHKVAIALEGAAKKVAGVVTNKQTTFDENATKLQKMMALDELEATILYADVLDGVDLEYVVVSNDIKENIIVKERAEAYSYSFTLSLNNLIATLNADGSISLCDDKTGDTMYTIPAGVMWDANGVESNAVTYTLTDGGNGKYTLTVTADTAWMNAADRAFPVTIDPPITSGLSEITVHTVASGERNYDSFAGAVATDAITYWNLGNAVNINIPTGAYLIEAFLKVDIARWTTREGEYLGVYDVITSWNTSSTWENAGALAGTYSDYAHIFNINNRQNITLVITDIVKSWQTNPNNEYDLAFALVNNTEYFLAQIYSDTAQLIVSYRDMHGYEDYWTYISQDLGFMGQGSVNLANGALIYTLPTLTTTDALLPITPALTMDSTLSNGFYIYPTTQSALYYTFEYSGTRLNINEQLVKRAAKNGIAEHFIWSDGDGTEHYFFAVSGQTGLYRDEDGLQLILQEGASTVGIIDANHNTRVFRKLYDATEQIPQTGYVLERIIDKDLNQLWIEIDSYGRPISLKLFPSGGSAITDHMQFMYETTLQRFCGVWNNVNKKGVIFRVTQNGTEGKYYIQQVVHVHGTDSATLEDLRAFYAQGINANTAKITVDGTGTFQYDAEGRITEVCNDFSKYKVNYTYDGTGRVVSIQETSLVGTTAEVGQAISISYGTKRTTVRTSGTDDVLNTADDLLTYYSFDNEGRVVSCYTTDKDNKRLYGASSGQYVGDDNANAKNSLKTTSQSLEPEVNYLRNGGFENGTAGWSLINATASAICHEGYGAAQLMVNSSQSTASISQTVALPAGTYTLSGYIYTYASQGISVKLKAQCMRDSTRTVEYEVPTNQNFASGGYTFVSLNFEAITDEQFTISVVAQGTPSTAKNVHVDNLMLSQTIGASEYSMVELGHFAPHSDYFPKHAWAYDTDYVAVRMGGAPFDESLCISTAPALPTSAMQTVYTAPDAVLDGYENGDYALANQPMIFTVSGWGKGTAQVGNPTTMFCLGLSVLYRKMNDSGTGTQTTEDLQYFHFDKYCNDWQFISGSIVTNPEKGLVEKVTVVLCYIGHPGKGYFDNIACVLDSTSAKVYDYNSAGYVSAYTCGKNTTWYQYHNVIYKGLVTSAISSNGSVYDYIYDDNGRCTKETYSTYAGMYDPETETFIGEQPVAYTATEYTYNAVGLLTQTKGFSVTDPSRYISSSTTYDMTDGSHFYGTVQKETDSLGNETRYFYDAYGQLRACVDPNGNGYQYSYDALGFLQSVVPVKLNEAQTDVTSSGLSHSVQYTYDAMHRLSSIVTGSTTYSFTYDPFSNASEVSVGGNSLVSYTYAENNGKMETITYANGFVAKYIYDELDRVKEIQYNTGDGHAFETVYQYVYTASGSLHAVIDYKNDEQIVYTYDALGKRVRTYTIDMYTDTMQYSDLVTYDAEGRVSGITHYLDYSLSNDEMRNDDLYTTYRYNAKNELSSVSHGGDGLIYSIVPTYDALGRTTNRRLAFYTGVAQDDAHYQTHSYQYVADGNNLSSRLASVTTELRVSANSSVISSTTYSYTYDSNGNITEIKDGNGVVQYQYYYDELNQLVRENNRPMNKTLVYTYDDAGNIISKRDRAFMEGDDVWGGTVFNYTYGNTAWGDQLTGYSYYTLSYDALGNVTMVRDPMDYMSDPTRYGWDGCFLTAYGYGSGDTFTTIANYYYNADGIRTGKRVNGVMHEYILNGTQIVAETWGEHMLVYLYDEAGTPIGLKYRNNTYAEKVYDCYFFEKNIFGDVVAIYDENGAKIGSYAYSAWGSASITIPTEVYGTTAYKILTQFNPFRYRGYYYDTETGLYYLQTRYYNPQWGRFISADSYVSTGLGILGCNMYAYCNNDPLMYKSVSIAQGRPNASENLGQKLLPTFGSFSLPLNIEFASGSYRDGLFFCGGTVTFLYAVDNSKLNFDFKEGRLSFGIDAKFSVINASGRLGLGNDDFNGCLVGNVDILTGSAMAGIFITPKDSVYVLGVDVGAALLTASAGAQFNLFGAQIEAGVEGQLVAASFSFGFGYNDGKLFYKNGIALLFGYEFYLCIDLNGG